MTELSTEWQVAELPANPRQTSVEQASPRTRPSSDHWSLRVRDPLGAALKRLNGQAGTIDVIESAKVWSPSIAAPVPATEPEELAPAVAILPLSVVESDSIDNTQSPADRRRFPRRQSECEVVLIDRKQVQDLTPQETDWMLRSSRQVGRLHDLSQTGLCIQLGREVAAGSEVLLRISNDHLNRHVDSAATVVNCQLSGHGEYSIHCRVLYDFTLDQLQDLGRPEVSAHVLG